MQLQQSQFPSLANVRRSWLSLSQHNQESKAVCFDTAYDARSISITSSTICDMRACDAAWAFTNAQHAARVQLENFL
jgi:hypothetical protein